MKKDYSLQKGTTFLEKKHNTEKPPLPSQPAFSSDRIVFLYYNTRAGNGLFRTFFPSYKD